MLLTQFPESNQELKIRLTTIVREVIKTEITEAEKLREARLRALEKASLKNCIFIDELYTDQGARHGVEIAGKHQRIKDLERLNLRLINAGESMVKLTNDSLDCPNSSLS